MGSRSHGTSQRANAHKLTSLPIVTVVDFAFTLAPSDVVHPYTVRGEDLETYSRKLDSQADEELWAASKAYLQRHAKAVARNPELGAPPTPETDARRPGGLTRLVPAAAKGMQAVLDVEHYRRADGLGGAGRLHGGERGDPAVADQ